MDPLRSTDVLSVCDARRSFGAVRALDGASFELRPGELLALLGPNGAGKTTLIRSIAGLLRLDSGEVWLFGERLGARGGRSGLAVVPQEIALYPLLTASENLQVFGRLQGLSATEVRQRTARMLDWIDLRDRIDDRVSTYSGGMKRRLNLACSVLHEPRVLLLDEPTVGVDPQSREKLYEMLAELRAGGTSIVLTTHHLEEAEERCERIVIIDHGRTIASGTLDELVAGTVGRRRSVTVTVDRLPTRPIDGVELVPGTLQLRTQVESAVEGLPGLLLRLREGGCRIQNLEVRSPSLQSVFIHLTGTELRE